MSDGFPLLTTKKMPWKTIVTELLWFLKGDTNIKYLLDNGCNIWTGDAYKHYLKWAGNGPLTIEEFSDEIKINPTFAARYGELGPIYGKQWRCWSAGSLEDKHGFGNIDQIIRLIKDLKTNPDSRRLMVSAWNVSEINQMILPPCHYGFQVYTRELSYEEKKLYTYKHFSNQPQFDLDAFEKFNIPSRAISLMWNQRSVDTFLGLPFNIASYALLLTIIAKEVNMIPEELIGNLGDTHLYLNHIEQAKEQIERESYELPTLKHLKDDSFYKSLSEDQSLYAHLENTDFILENYTCHPTIKAPLSN
jgi:thymidylate synthase